MEGRRRGERASAHVAARLQAFAPPGSVVLGQGTYELVREAVDVRSLGSPDLKGKSQATEVFELLGIRSAAIAVPAES